MMSKNQLKKKYKNFWRNNWVKFDLNIWQGIISGQQVIDPRDPYKRAVLSNHKYKTMLSGALIKLHLEHKITEEERDTMITMLESSDSDSNFIALCVIRKYKPKEFKRIKPDSK